MTSTPKTAPTISPDAARHVLWHYGHEGGIQPGSFTQNLMTAIATADLGNKAKLAIPFPDYVAAALAIEYDPEGVAYLQRIARQDAA
jgi:hypothetical protein